MKSYILNLNKLIPELVFPQDRMVRGRCAMRSSLGLLMAAAGLSALAAEFTIAALDITDDITLSHCTAVLAGVLGEGVLEREYWRGSVGKGVLEREYWRGGI